MGRHHVQATVNCDQLFLAEAAIEQLEDRRLAALQHDGEHGPHALLHEQGAARLYPELGQRELFHPALDFLVAPITDQRREVGSVTTFAKLLCQDLGQRPHAVAAHYGVHCPECPDCEPGASTCVRVTPRKRLELASGPGSARWHARAGSARAGKKCAGLELVPYFVE